MINNNTIPQTSSDIRIKTDTEGKQISASPTAWSAPLTWMGGMSGREGKFSGFVTEGMSSIAETDGLVGPRFALAIVAVVGLVGLIVVLCTETTGKGPAWPGLECCREREETVSALRTNQPARARQTGFVRVLNKTGAGRTYKLAFLSP